MNYWQIDRLEGGLQHDPIPWPGPIDPNPNYIDFPRKRQQFRPTVQAPPQQVTHERFEQVQGDLTNNLPGIPQRYENSDSQYKIITSAIKSLQINGTTQDKPSQTLSQELEFLESQPREISSMKNAHEQPQFITNHHTYKSKDRSPSSGSEMGDENFGINGPNSTTAFTSPGPGPGPGPSSRPALDPLHIPTIRSTNGDQTRRALGLEKRWQKLRKLRLSTWSQRSRVHEMRTALRLKQQVKSTADDKYFQLVRLQNLGIVPHNQTPSKMKKTMEELFRACQLARDEYGPLEDDCNWVEDQLSRDEFELNKLEEHFYSQMSSPQSFRDLDRQPEVVSPIASAYSDSDVGQDPYHPLVSKYLSKLGDVDILKERLGYHIEEKLTLEYEKESREHVNINLGSDEQEWLEDYQEAEAKLLRQIKEAEEDASTLKEECLKEGLVDMDGKAKDFESLERQTFMGDLNAGNEKSEFVKFPALIPTPSSQEVRFYDSAPKSGEISNSAGDHINQWLLHQLRSSPMEVNMLVRIFEAKFWPIEDDNWQIDVLTFWYVDGARKDASKYQVTSSGIADRAIRNSGSISSGKSESNGTEPEFPDKQFGEQPLGRGFHSGPESLGSRK